MKKLLLVVCALSAISITGCSTDASVASYNLSKSAEMFELNRRIVLLYLNDHWEMLCRFKTETIGSNM